jgi:hypothetical protein
MFTRPKKLRAGARRADISFPECRTIKFRMIRERHDDTTAQDVAMSERELGNASFEVFIGESHETIGDS